MATRIKLISELAPAGTLTGDEFVPVVQGGVTVKATVSDFGSAAFDADFASKTTSDLAEGSNLYFTNGRASAAAPVQSVAGRTGAVTLTASDIAGLPSSILSQVLTGYSVGSNAVLIDTDTVLLAFGKLQGQIAGLVTTDVAEGSNLYYTDARVATYIGTIKAVANGVASLDSSGKIPSSQIPAIAITDTFTVASQAAMLALSAETGDVAVRSDVQSSFILQGSDPSILANWVLLLSPADGVISVGLSLPSELTVSSSPVTSTGTLTATWASQASNLVLASPTSGSGTPSFRSLVADDLPTVPATKGGTGQTVYAVGDMLYASTTTALSKLADVAAGSVLVSGGIGVAPSWASSITLTALNLAGLTASSAVATDSSKNLVSIANTGTGSNVLNSSPTIRTFLTVSGTTGGAVLPTPITGTIMQIGNDDGSATRVEIFGFDFDAARILGRRSRGTVSTPTATTSNQVLLGVAGTGYGATGWVTTTRASVNFVASENWSDTAQGTRILFNTTPSGSTTVAEVWRMSEAGSLSNNVASGTAYIHLKAGTATASTAPIKFTSGTNLTAAEAGAFEWNGTNLFITQTTGPTRKTLAFTDSNTTGSAATLTTARAIYGNNFDGSAALTQIIASTYGGTGNGFTKFSGPTTSEKIFTLPNVGAAILTDAASGNIITNSSSTASLYIGTSGSGSAIDLSNTGTAYALHIATSNGTGMYIQNIGAGVMGLLITPSSTGIGLKVTGQGVVLPVTTATSTATAESGLMHFKDVSGVYTLQAYINGGWRSVALV